MPDKHLSTQFDAELNHISGMVMEMGGLVEQQLRQAVEAMTDYNIETAKAVRDTEPHVNSLELQIDHELVSIIGRRQPTARDLRLLIAISRTTANLEPVTLAWEQIDWHAGALLSRGRLTGLPVDTRLLLRTRRTPRQVGLGREDRERNMRGAFMVPDTRKAALVGRRPILVDDVLTTGATLEAATRALLAAGAAAVDVLTLARVVAPS